MRDTCALYDNVSSLSFFWNFLPPQCHTGLLLGDIFRSWLNWSLSHWRYLVAVHNVHFYSVAYKTMPSLVLSWPFKARCESVVNWHRRDFGTQFICSYGGTVSDVGVSSGMRTPFQGKETPGALWYVFRVRISTKRDVPSPRSVRKSYLEVCLQVRTWFTVQVNFAN
jgi:hypothetical protein